MDELAITKLNENMLLYLTKFLEEDTITFFKSLSSSIYIEYLGSELIQKNKVLLLWGPCAST